MCCTQTNTEINLYVDFNKSFRWKLILLWIEFKLYVLYITLIMIETAWGLIKKIFCARDSIILKFWTLNINTFQFVTEIANFQSSLLGAVQFPLNNGYRNENPPPPSPPRESWASLYIFGPVQIMAVARIYNSTCVCECDSFAGKQFVNYFRLRASNASMQLWPPPQTTTWVLFRRKCVI